MALAAFPIGWKALNNHPLGRRCLGDTALGSGLLGAAPAGAQALEPSGSRQLVKSRFWRIRAAIIGPGMNFYTWQQAFSGIWESPDFTGPNIANDLVVLGAGVDQSAADTFGSIQVFDGGQSGALGAGGNAFSNTLGQQTFPGGAYSEAFISLQFKRPVTIGSLRVATGNTLAVIPDKIALDYLAKAKSPRHPPSTSVQETAAGRVNVTTGNQGWKNYLVIYPDRTTVYFPQLNAAPTYAGLSYGDLYQGKVVGRPLNEDVPFISAITPVAGSATASSLAVPKPSGVKTGDLMLAWVTNASGSGTVSSTGWTLMSTRLDTGSKQHNMMYRVADSGDEGGADYTFNANPSNSTGSVCIIALRSPRPEKGMGFVNSTTYVKGTSSPLAVSGQSGTVGNWMCIAVEAVGGRSPMGVSVLMEQVETPNALGIRTGNLSVGGFPNIFIGRITSANQFNTTVNVEYSAAIATTEILGVMFQITA